ncbi:SEL1-like repeat protein, partial [Aliarcobacter butzleri]
MKKIIAGLVIALIVGFIFIKFSESNDLEKANTAYNEKKYDMAFPIYEKAANQGHQQAQDKLGIMYQEGIGVEKDYKKAF